MAVVPYTPAFSILQIEILINGTNGGLHTLLKKLEVQYELNKIPFAKLDLIASNPDLEADDAPLESAALVVNDEIEILVTTDDISQTLFKGMIYKIDNNADPVAGFDTKIECKDICINLTGQQDVVADETFAEKMDRFLQKFSIANEVSLGAWSEEVVSKTINITPWDYIISYLDSLGFMANIREGSFTVFDSTAAGVEAKYLGKNGVNVFEFEGREQEAVANVQVQYWNPETQAIETQESETEVENAEGNEVVDLSQSNYSPETLSQMAKALAAKNRLAVFHGNVKTYGNLTAKYGDNLSFEKVNETIDDKPLIIYKEFHVIENGCWNTSYDFGLETNQSFAENISVTAASSTARAGQTNNVQGLQIGVVTQIEDDPKKEFRIRVRIPTIDATGDGVWARLASFQAGSKRGAFFIPEVNDEVVLGCFNNNPDTPVILGKMYSSAHEMPFPIEKENNIQGIVSREDTKIIINDKEKSVEISTKAGNKILISDDKKGIVLEDQNKNRITMDDKGITIESAKDLILKAPSGNFNVEGVKNSLKATANMELSGKLIKLN